MRIYLDHAATTPLAPEVRAAMEPWLAAEFGNPSSMYAEGRRAKQAIDEAREVVSTSLGCLFGEVVFTSSGTEAANLAMIGTALANPDPRRNRVLIGAAEHHCVLHTRPILERLGYRVGVIPVDAVARIQIGALAEMIDDDVLLVAAMHANNELGTIQDLAPIVELAHANGSLVFVDAVQTFLTSTAPVWMPSLGADMVSLAAHKIYGPKGIGALAVRSATPIQPITTGGGQEREMRAGTEFVAGIVGFAAAVHTANPQADDTRKRAARDALLEGLQDSGAVISRSDNELSGHAHLRFPGIGAESMLIVLDRLGVSASSGAACSSGSIEPSHVLLACGYSPEEASGGLRFTFGRGNTIDEAKEAARRVLQAVDQVGLT